MTAHPEVPVARPPLVGKVHRGTHPAPEVIVTVTDQVGAQVARVRTDAGGEFRVDGLPPGGYVLIFSGPGHHPHATTVVLAAGRPPLDVALAAIGTVRGVVRDAGTGQPVAAATVTVVGPDGEVLGSTVSDPDGSYCVTGIDAEEVTLAVAAPAAEPFATVVGLGAGPDRTVDVPLATYSTITGRVTAGGRAVGGLELVLRDDRGRPLATTETDADGGYRFDRITAGTYTLTSATSRPRSVPAGAAAEVVDLALRPPDRTT